MFDETKGHKLKSHVPGQSPARIAKDAGFEVPENTKVLVIDYNKLMNPENLK